MNLPIEDSGERPAGKPGICFYCNQPVTSEHKLDCVILKKAVVVTRTMTYVIDVPRDWDKNMIEFHRNESSSCADNDLTLLVRTTHAENGGCPCTCRMSETLYVRDATEEDIEGLPRTFLYPSKVQKMDITPSGS